jgi:hypothetical protein
MPVRTEALIHWLHESAGLPPFEIAPASSDASFRRYFRVRFEGQSLIAMDAPPTREDCRPWLAIAQRLRDVGLNAPEVIHADPAQGFILMADLGARLYLAELNPDTVERLYGDALGALVTLQACGGADGVPSYDRTLLRNELELFRDWYLGRHLGLTLDAAQQAVLDAAWEVLIANALEQPTVLVHRDYHSRNLLVTGANNPGIVDFQDAVSGPVTYDLVSLLRDCYISWPRVQVEDWVRGYHELALQSGILAEEGEARFLRWFDLMGVQRHLKATGIFARLNHRDGKPGYLNDIPRTLGYVREVAARHAELEPFLRLMEALPVQAPSNAVPA